ncbi:MAG: hypothetical protein JWR34_5782 [Mycobacterium sp.]|nr:hypothetical protein [Mycobacterium sp.]
MQLDVLAAPPLQVLHQLPCEFVPFDVPRGLERGRRRSASAAPRSPATVENLANISQLLPTWLKIAAFV